MSENVQRKISIIEPEKLNDLEKIFFKPCLIKCVYLSVSFMLLFSAFNSTQNIVSLVYKQLNFGDLGNIAIFALYFAFAISSFFSVQLVSIISNYKVCFILAGLGYNIFVGLGYLVTFCPNTDPGNGQGLNRDVFYCQQGVVYTYMIIGSMMTGVSAAIIWVSQGMYLDIIGSQCPSRAGTFIGVFWTIMQFSQILGNVLSYFLFGISQQLYFFVMLMIGLAGNACFCFLPNALSDEQQQAQILKEEQSEQKKEIPKISNLIALLKLKEIYPFIVIMSFTGLTVGFYSGFLYKQVATAVNTTDETLLDQKFALVCIVLGVFEVIAGLTSGRLADIFNLYKLATFGTLLAEAALVISLIASFKDSYALTFFVGAIWGFCDCYFNTIVQAICKQDYPGRIEIYSIFRFVLAIINCIVQVMSITIEQQYIFISILIAVQMVGNISTSIMKKPNFDQINKLNSKIPVIDQKKWQNGYNNLDNEGNPLDNGSINEDSLKTALRNQQQ